MAKVNKVWNQNKLEYDIDYYLPINDKDINKSNIIDQYFSRLSRQAVLHGAGIIDLFNKQAADAVFAKEYSPHIFQFSMPQITIPAISLVGEGYKTGIISFAAQTISSIGNFFSNIFGGSNRGSVQIVNNTSQNNVISGINIQTAQAVQAASNANQNIVNKIQVQKPIQSVSQQTQVALIDNQGINQQIQQIASTTTQQIATTTTQQTIQLQQAVFQQCNFQTNQSPSRQKSIINEIAWMGTTENANNEWIELKNISNSDINLNGWQLIDQNEKIKITFGNYDKDSS